MTLKELEDIRPCCFLCLDRCEAYIVVADVAPGAGPGQGRYIVCNVCNRDDRPAARIEER